MGRGSSGTRRAGGGGGLNPADIVSTELMTWSGQRTQAEQDFFNVAEALHNEYGNSGVPQNFFLIADLKGRAANNVIAYYDGSNVGLNRNFLNSPQLTSAYDQCVKQGFHPGRGNKSAAEAVAAHELGHRLTDAAGAKMGTGISIDSAAGRIVNEARQQTNHRGVIKMASKISGYATASNAETVAEAFADVFCNGSKAAAESRAVVNVLNKYVKGSG